MRGNPNDADGSGDGKPTVTIESVETETESWTGKEVNGILRLKEQRPDRNNTHVLPFRKRSADPNTPYQDPPPYIWLWKNPNEPLSQISLHPSYKVSTIHIKVRDGNIYHV